MLHKHQRGNPPIQALLCYNINNKTPNHFCLPLTNITLPKMKSIITSVIASILLLPNSVHAGLRDQVNQALQQDSARNAACLELWNQAQFQQNSSDLSYNYRRHVDRVGNVKFIMTGKDDLTCDAWDMGMVNVERVDIDGIPFIFHIEDVGLVEYKSNGHSFHRTVYPFR